MSLISGKNGVNLYVPEKYLGLGAELYYVCWTNMARGEWHRDRPLVISLGVRGPGY